MSSIIQKSMTHFVTDQGVALYNCLTQHPSTTLAVISSIGLSAILRNFPTTTEKNDRFVKQCLKPIVTGCSTWAISAIVSQIAGLGLTHLFLATISTIAIGASAFIEARKHWQEMANKVNVMTLNVLNDPSDCLEFRSNLGSQKIDQQKDRITALLIPQQFYLEKAGCTDQLSIDSAKIQDRMKGPTVAELFNPTVMAVMSQALDKAGCETSEWDTIEEFVKECKDMHLFHFVKTYSGKILGLEQSIMKAGIFETLPTVNSTVLLDEKATDEQLRLDLTEKLFNQNVFDAIKLNDSFKKIEASIKNTFDGPSPSVESLKALAQTKSGVIFLYCLYQSINLSLVKNNGKIKDLNEIKTSFKNQISNSETREKWLLNQLSDREIQVLFTQEATNLSKKVKDRFHDLKTQNPGDGTCVWLEKATWQTDYEVIAPKKDDGKINMVIATHARSKRPYLLASLHGHSSNKENGRELIKQVVTEFNEQKKSHPNLKLIIGTDANTKTPDDIAELDQVLNDLGLQRTEVGLTTIKCRLVTTQVDKCLKEIAGQGDFVITEKKAKLLNVGKGSQTGFWKTGFGLFFRPSSIDDSLPNAKNPADHYPVYATVE
ncbi:MAG: hypothetical protein ACH350_07460 [Parachlamydiaceae bacterium]